MVNLLMRVKYDHGGNLVVLKGSFYPCAAMNYLITK